MVYDFQQKLAYSRGIREKTDLETIKKIILNCINVKKTTIEEDKNGVDYIALLKGGAQILIDAKTREMGCSKYWRYGPELAPEIWSVMPGGKYLIPKEKAKVGWTLCDKKNVDYIYCTFHPVDTDEFYFLPFQLYRIAFVHNLPIWKTKYKIPRPQDSGSWQSQCIFIPANIVIKAIENEMKYKFQNIENFTQHKNINVRKEQLTLFKRNA